jgi:peptidoglycan/xylan/chitin deacetylase (PgdA/CDA1 family)
MIGVLAREEERVVVAEFFELFKTPWEFYRSGSDYDVLICSNTQIQYSSAKLVLIYGYEQSAFDRERKITIVSRRKNRIISHDDARIPTYGDCLGFKTGGSTPLLDEQTRESVALEVATPVQTFLRMGFDLFGEISYLLTHGQPLAYSHFPTLELHVALLRNLIVSRSIPLVEIPPVPAGHNFISCLTHDVDHPAIRPHKFDHTLFGFLYRATIGSLTDFCRGRRSFKQLATNWLAAFSLPLVHLGLVKDLWDRFDRYLELEEGLTSTFFFIPKKGVPGTRADRRAPSKRATQYDVGDVQDQLDALISAGREIACHGIDAWHDPERGHEELERIRNAAGISDIGVRSHWLYFDERSPAAFEQAGFAYDSTVGYNESIGYRAGTAQVFKPFTVSRLLELPMHIMDTAMFYPAYMNLSLDQAKEAIKPLLDNASRFGGVLTVNWHDRSIAPERFWDEPYKQLLTDLKSKGAWFATAAKAVAWFKQRRSAKIDNVAHDGDKIRVRVAITETAADLPGLIVRLHQSPSQYVDRSISESGELELPAV